MLNFVMHPAAIHDAPPAQPAPADLEAAQQPPANPAVLALPAALQNLPARPHAFGSRQHIAETVVIAGVTAGCAAGAATFTLGLQGDAGWKPAMAIEMVAIGMGLSAVAYLAHLNRRAANPLLAATNPPSPQEGALPEGAVPQHQQPV